jgi:hypothetical protein
MPPKRIKLYSTQDAAKELGISVPRVKQIREAMDVGQMVARTLVFTDADLDRMRQRNTSPGPKGPRAKEGQPE